MKSTHSSIGLRQQLRKDLRKHDLEKRFKENRSLMKDIQIQADQKEFNQIYPNIDDQNYQQHLGFFIKYLYNDNYNFMLLSFTGYIYQFLLQNPQRSEGYVILEGLSVFQEIEIPQTGQFAEIMSNNLFLHGKAIMNIIANLLSFPRYAAFLRQYLCQFGFIEEAEKYISHLSQTQKATQNQIYINYLFISIFSSFIKIHPILNQQNIEQLVMKIRKHLNGTQQISLIMQTLDQISSSLDPNNKIATIFISNFNEILIQQYFTYEQEIIHFATYCIRSKVKISNNLFFLLVKSLQTSKNQALGKLLIFLSIMIQTYKTQFQTLYYEDLKDYQIQNKIISIFCISSSTNKIKCLQILQNMVYFMVKDQNQSLQILIQKIVQHFGQTVEILNGCLNILHKILFQIMERQSQKWRYVKILEEINFQSRITTVNVGPEKLVILQQILILYNQIKKCQSILSQSIL